MKKHLEAIASFPRPTSTTDMKSYMALCNQVAYAFPIKEVLQWSEEQTLDKLQKFMLGSASVCTLRHQFFYMKQQQGESIVNYAHRLESAAEDCEFTFDYEGPGTNTKTNEKFRPRKHLHSR